MEKLDRAVTKLGNIVDIIIIVIGGTGLLVCIGMCMYNVLSWWITGTRVAFCDEISLIGLVWTSYVGMGYLYRCHGHCTMDFVVKALPPLGQVIVRILTNLIILVVAVVTVRYSWALAVKSMNKRLLLTRIPYFYCDISVTLGYAHLLVLVIVDTIRNVGKLIHWKGGLKEQ